MKVPARVDEACARGVVQGEFRPLRDAAQMLDRQRSFGDGATRARDGRLLITCMTEMPGVTPAMIDWWFGWHLTSSERYRLWHPRDHVACTVQEDRSHLADDRARYIGNVSYVDEYIGPQLKKLSIAFRPPGEIGMGTADASPSTTIFASTADRVLGGQGGHLVHHVFETEQGCQMRSAFWLGDMSHSHPWVNRLSAAWLNTGPVRRLIVSDRMAIDLLRHCAQEMNHLAQILPALWSTHRQ